MYSKLFLPEAFFQPKMHQIAFGGRAPLAPAGGALKLPRPPSRNMGPTSKGRGGERRKERDGRGVERKGRGKGKGKRRKRGKGIVRSKYSLTPKNCYKRFFI